MTPRTEIAIVFNGVLAAGSQTVRELVAALPTLVGHPIDEYELAIEQPGGSLLVAIRIDGIAPPEGIQRVRFWTARLGGTVNVLGPDDASLAAHWRARVAACSTSRACSSPDELTGSFDAVAGPTPRLDERAPRGPRLLIDIGGPGSEGIAFNARDRLLFVPGPLAPPVGDELELCVSAGGLSNLGRCSARVVRVRGVAARPGAPAGYVLHLGAIPERIAAALVTSCASMNADAMVEEARRSAPRYPVRLAVDLRVTGTRRTPAEAEPAIEAHVVSLSIGGAFVETSSAPPVGATLELQFRHRSDESFATTASVVYATSTGVGIKFRLSPSEETALGRLIARISARPRRALVVDDDALARQMIGDALADLGYDIVTALDGEHAMRVLGSELYALDAVVTDLRMDGLDGSQIVQALNSARDNVQVAIVVVTGFSERDIVRRLTRAGADAVLEKGVEPEQIAATVDALVEAVRTDRQRAGLPTNAAR